MVMVVAGVHDLLSHWYGLKLGSGPPSPLWTTVLRGGGVKTGTGAPTRSTHSFRRLGGWGGPSIKGFERMPNPFEVNGSI